MKASYSLCEKNLMKDSAHTTNRQQQLFDPEQGYKSEGTAISLLRL